MPVKLFKCEKCGDVFWAINSCGCVPQCCGDKLKVLEPQTGNPDENKHVPYIEKTDGGVIVKVGKVESHPMTPEHYIMWIQVEADGIVMSKNLTPNDKPEAFFPVKSSRITAFEYCNKHGLWKSQ